MLHIKSLDEGLELFKALGSDIRVEIIKLLLENKNMSMNELAASLNITNGALTSHIKKLEDCGIVSASTESPGHGNQKICAVCLNKILIDFLPKEEFENIYESNIRVGHYSDYSIYPTCGLASDKGILGEIDDPRYYAHPSRYDADMLWFTKGYVEYIIPNLISASQTIEQITVSMEFSSKVPCVNDEYCGSILFYLNETCIGKWKTPGDFESSKGIFTPEWWFPKWDQHGSLKILTINNNGTFIDGMKISDIKISDFKLNYKSNIKLKIDIPANENNKSGLTIFGKTFGNYNQDINVRIKYSSL